MLIQVSSNGAVSGYSEMGEMSDSVEYDGTLPDGFPERCMAYRMIDGHLVYDAELDAKSYPPEPPPPPDYTAFIAGLMQAMGYTNE